MKKTTIYAAVAVLALIGAAGCSSELDDNAAPVELIVTNTQNLNQIDLQPAADNGCDQNVGTINLQTVAKNDTATGNLLQVRATRYRVSYQRTDGGTLVPSPFVRSIDRLVGIGGSTALGDFVIVQSDAITQAPFAALLPQNGGRDPETQRPVVKMDVIVEVFGETLGGANVKDATRFPLDFCYACGGCN